MNPTIKDLAEKIAETAGRVANGDMDRAGLRVAALETIIEAVRTMLDFTRTEVTAAAEHRIDTVAYALVTDCQFNPACGECEGTAQTQTGEPGETVGCEACWDYAVHVAAVLIAADLIKDVPAPDAKADS